MIDLAVDKVPVAAALRRSLRRMGRSAKRGRSRAVAVHVFDGFLEAGPRHSALCSCGWFTHPPAASRSQATAELAERHQLSPLVCARCGQHQPEINHYGAPRHLVLTFGPDGRHQLECTLHHGGADPAADGPAEIGRPGRNPTGHTPGRRPRRPRRRRRPGALPALTTPWGRSPPSRGRCPGVPTRRPGCRPRAHRRATG